MVKIRLWRAGSTHRPFYRIVAADSRVKRDGKYLEQIGHHDPIRHETKIDEAVAMKWLQNGAQPTDTVRNLLKKQGIIKKFKENK